MSHRIYNHASLSLTSRLISHKMRTLDGRTDGGGTGAGGSSSPPNLLPPPSSSASYLPSFLILPPQSSERGSERRTKEGPSQPRLIAHAHKTFSLLRRRDVGGRDPSHFLLPHRRARRAVIAAVTAADIGARMAAGVGADGRAARRNDLHWLDKHLNNTFEASGQGVRHAAPVILKSRGTIRFRMLELRSEKVDFFMLTSIVEFFPPA